MNVVRCHTQRSGKDIDKKQTDKPDMNEIQYSSYLDFYVLYNIENKAIKLPKR